MLVPSSPFCMQIYEFFTLLSIFELRKKSSSINPFNYLYPLIPAFGPYNLSNVRSSYISLLAETPLYTIASVAPQAFMAKRCIISIEPSIPVCCAISTTKMAILLTTSTSLENANM